VSGIAFTSERQLSGAGPAEASATIVHRVLAELGAEDDVLLWNVVPTHPGTASSNRRPSRPEIEASRPFLDELARGRRVVAVGRVAAGVLDAPYVRHPSHGGAVAFAAGLRRRLAA
jgi:uracil-DNA glycosylase